MTSPIACIRRILTAACVLAAALSPALAPAAPAALASSANSANSANYANDANDANDAKKAPPRKVVFLAGAPDGHGKGTHEYAKDLQLLKACLDASPNVKGIATEIHTNGWPEDANALNDAAAIVVHTTGANSGNHPLLKGKRLEWLGRQMKRGCGLVVLHYSLFMPNGRGGPEFLEWIGGYDDYERKYSSHRVTTKDPPPATPATPGHPISRGWKAFTIKNEFYIRQRFGENDSRLVPILTTLLPADKPQKQVIAWAVERTGGGRGFGFTGGHFHDNWRTCEDLRRMMLNAVVWAAGLDVPEGGVQSAVPPAGEGDWKLIAGKDFGGWQTKGNWAAQDGSVLYLEPRPGERGWQRYDAYLWSDRPYGDFVLDLEFRIPKGGNSGVFVRVGDLKSPVGKGIEVQINDTYGKKSPGAHDCGGIIGVTGPSKNTARPAGEWNRMVVTCRGTKLQVELNGEQIVDLAMDTSAVKDRPPAGYVGLQDHGLPLWFRNVRIKELGGK